jgi:hypothetical protein
MTDPHKPEVGSPAACDAVRYVLTSHLQCDSCGHGRDHALEVVVVEANAISAAEVIACPSCHAVLDIDVSNIELRTAWPTSRGAGRRTERRGGRVVVRGNPITE